MKLALDRLDPPGRTGVAWLTREFNQRYGGKPISTHAARKWLLGESIPTHDKLLTLASWLKVSSEWLLYGEGSMQTVTVVQQKQAVYGTDEIPLLQAIRSLNREHRHIVQELVATLVRLEGRDVPFG
ncbi:hypothetical protein B9N43_16710 [Denitratisoma sp. DHT3]|nr:hypothetical protein B9N43_16710 [Denitratisoma sp. DHT3]